MKLVNICAHDIDVISTRGEIIHLSPSGIVARISPGKLRVENAIRTDENEIIELMEYESGDIHNLPAPQAGLRYIASQPLAERAFALGRIDVLHPIGIIHDGAGQGVRCRGLRKPRSIGFV
jgi:hypothetical protein